MAEIISNKFTTTINKGSTEPTNLGDELITEVNIYQRGVQLTPVSCKPHTNQ